MVPVLYTSKMCRPLIITIAVCIIILLSFVHNAFHIKLVWGVQEASFSRNTGQCAEKESKEGKFINVYVHHGLWLHSHSIENEKENTTEKWNKYPAKEPQCRWDESRCVIYNSYTMKNTKIVININVSVGCLRFSFNKRTILPSILHGVLL